MKCRLPLEQLGYDYAEKAGVPGHHIFGRGRDFTDRTHLLHVVKYLGTSWATGLALRDRLRGDPKLCAEYVRERSEQLRQRPKDELDTTNSRGRI